MIRVQASDGLFELSGSVEELLAEVCATIKVLVSETNKQDSRGGELIKSIIIDQIQNDFDATRIKLFDENKNEVILC